MTTEIARLKRNNPDQWEIIRKVLERNDNALFLALSRLPIDYDKYSRVYDYLMALSATRRPPLRAVTLGDEHLGLNEKPIPEDVSETITQAAEYIISKSQ